MTAKPSNTNRILLALVVANLLVMTLVLFRSPDRPVSTSPASVDATLLQQADSVAQRINAVGSVTGKNVVEAAQLWREAQLTLEAAIISGETPEFVALSSSTAKLQTSLAEVIPGFVQSAYTNARKASTLRDGLTRWAGAGAYLALYPNDGTPEAAEAAQKMGYEHERVRQELLQKAQTKYNLWACEQIKKAWLDIKDVNSPVSKSDNTKFYHSCVHFLSPIDSSLLDMSTGELYREVLQFVRERMPMEDFQELIKEIQNGKKRSLDSAD
ncbi:MAG: hypothetical protein K9N51_08900 [Candidatus Pacebacteria bacterium]|nr:hypothetical protein [Candidatus Paceibacterota bacterium]